MTKDVECAGTSTDDIAVTMTGDADASALEEEWSDHAAAARNVSQRRSVNE